MRVAGAAPSITTSSLPSGTVGVTYPQQNLSANGGLPPYTWSISAGALPDGLALSGGGAITGTPTKVKNYSFTVKVSDLLTLSDTQAFQVAINPATPPTISTISLAPATAGTAYQQQTFSATGGTLPFTWSISAGSLPAGLTLAPNGTLSGTPTAVGTSNFTVKVTDAASQSDTKAFQIVVSPAPTPLSITTSSLPAGEVGAVYPQQTLSATGGAPPYTWAITTGSLPAGLTLAANGAIAGTPTAAGTSNFTVTVTDAPGQPATKALQIVINPPPTVSTSSLPAGEVGAAYPQQTLSAIGGAPPYTWAITAGSLPAGLTLAATGVITGTPTAAGTSNFTVTVTDAAHQSATKALQIVINPPPTISTTSLPSGTAGTIYTQQNLAATGGVPPYTWTVSAGSLPSGLSLASTGAITGTPTAAGTSNFTVKVTDSANLSDTKALQIVITAPLTVTTSSLPSGTVGAAYTQQTLSASGGTSPYTWSVSAGSLPAGLALAASGAITGTPTAAGTSSFTVKVTDAANQSNTKALQIVVNPAPTPPTISTTSLPPGTVGVSYPAQTLAATGGTPPYTWSLSAGSLPTGLALAASGAITGTPSAAGTFNFTVKVTDSASLSAVQPLQIVVSPAVSPLVITTDSLPSGTAGTAYPQQTLSATGGTAPYQWSVSAGSVPPGLTLAGNGTFGGTPSTAGTYNFTIQVTDAANQTNTKAFQIVINPASTPPTINTGSLPSGTAGTAYPLQSLSASGGTPPYTWSVSAGSLPTGLTLAGTGTITGTPTTAGTFSFTAKVTDAGNLSSTKALQIVINPGTAPPAISTTSLPSGTVGASYPQQTLSATGGTPPYTWSISAGLLPSGLTLAANGTLTGTPTTAGTSNITVKVVDSANQSAFQALQIVINPAPAPPAITSDSLPRGIVGVAFSFTLAASGGQGLYTWSLVTGALPGGVTLDGTTGQIRGTPTAAGTFTFTVRVTDGRGGTGDKALTIVVSPAISISACPAANGQTGINYSSNLVGSGGTPPYTWSATGQVPPGLALNSSTGTLSGTPIVPGTFVLTLQIADTANQNATRSCTVAIASPLGITTQTLPDATTRAVYNQTVAVTGGTQPYQWATSGGSLPPGLVLDSRSGNIAGTPTQPGGFTFTITVTDSAGGQAQRAYTINVSAGLTIPACPFPTASVGQSYTSTLAVIGGQSPYTWSLTTGSLPAGLALGAQSGTVAGSPTAAGSSSFTIQAAEAGGGTTSRACSIAVAPQLTITSTSVSDGSIGSPYTESIAATGGTPPYTWTVSGGALPPGLTLNAATGAISGLPSQAGSTSFTIHVVDAAGVATEKNFTLQIGSGFAITACPAPSATAGQPYSSAATLAGGDPSVTWSIVGGALPSGITLAGTTGTITGTPTQLGSSDFSIKATNASASSTRACTITVSAAVLSVTTAATLPDAVLGSKYSQALAATGGRAPYAWSLAGGSLPPGLTLNADGSFSGAPTTAGPFAFTARVTDQDKAVVSQVFSLTVLPGPAPVVTFDGLTAIVAPAQQPPFSISLASGYPVPLKGHLVMTFTPDPGINVDDPSITFITGGRTMDFDVPANTTTPVFAVPQAALQTGTVAGTIQITVQLLAGDLDVTPSPAPSASVRIDRTAPVITNVKITSVANGFQISVTGFSTTRDVSTATFQFTPAAGSSLVANQVAVPTAAAAQKWYSDPSSANFGGQFTLVQPFTLQGATLTDVSVTLTNGQGTSQATKATF